MKRISIKDVAEAAGVSTATVSNVFSGKKPVNVELAARVRDVADKLGYTVNKAASQLRSGRNSVVCMLVPDLADPFFTSIITEIEHRARADGYEIIVGNSDDTPEIEAGRLNALLAWEPAGAIVIPCTDQLPQQLTAKTAPPCVLVDRVANFGVVDTVTIDNIGAGESIGVYLGKSGHKNVLIAASDLAIHPIRQRADGVTLGLKRYGGEAKTVQLGADPEVGADLLSAWFDDNTAPTAICATTDMTTLAVLRFLADRQIDLPFGVSVVGFDDYAWMSARRTKLTAIRQPVEEIAEAVWSQLLKRINGESGPVVNTVLETELLIRDSVKSISAQGEKGGGGEILDIKGALGRS